ncbi:hypothetical protein HDU97_008007 [Phlyctochytrium planicorne]|nr:hypothetical protein HDU97_008007 [Phlyctochytrium planicorne]
MEGENDAHPHPHAHARNRDEIEADMELDGAILAEDIASIEPSSTIHPDEIVESLAAEALTTTTSSSTTSTISSFSTTLLTSTSTLASTSQSSIPSDHLANAFSHMIQTNEHTQQEPALSSFRSSIPVPIPVPISSSPTIPAPIRSYLTVPVRNSEVDLAPAMAPELETTDLKVGEDGLNPWVSTEHILPALESTNPKDVAKNALSEMHAWTHDTVLPDGHAKQVVESEDISTLDAPEEAKVHDDTGLPSPKVVQESEEDRSVVEIVEEISELVASPDLSTSVQSIPNISEDNIPLESQTAHKDPVGNVDDIGTTDDTDPDAISLAAKLPDTSTKEIPPVEEPQYAVESLIDSDLAEVDSTDIEASANPNITIQPEFEIKETLIPLPEEGNEPKPSELETPSDLQLDNQEPDQSPEISSTAIETTSFDKAHVEPFTSLKLEPSTYIPIVSPIATYIPTSFTRTIEPSETTESSPEVDVQEFAAKDVAEAAEQEFAVEMPVQGISDQMDIDALQEEAGPTEEILSEDSPEGLVEDSTKSVFSAAATEPFETMSSAEPANDSAEPAVLAEEKAEAVVSKVAPEHSVSSQVEEEVISTLEVQTNSLSISHEASAEATETMNSAVDVIPEQYICIAADVAADTVEDANEAVENQLPEKEEHVLASPEMKPDVVGVHIPIVEEAPIEEGALLEPSQSAEEVAVASKETEDITIDFPLTLAAQDEDSTQTDLPLSIATEVKGDALIEESPASPGVMDHVNTTPKNTVGQAHDVARGTGDLVKNVFGFSVKNDEMVTEREPETQPEIIAALEEVPVPSIEDAKEQAKETGEEETTSPSAEKNGPLPQPDTDAVVAGELPDSPLHEPSLASRGLDHVSQSMQDTMGSVTGTMHNAAEAVKNAFGYGLSQSSPAKVGEVPVQQQDEPLLAPSDEGVSSPTIPTAEGLASPQEIGNEIEDTQPETAVEKDMDAPFASEPSPSEHNMMERVNETIHHAMEDVNEAVNDTVQVVKNIFGFGKHDETAESERAISPIEIENHAKGSQPIPEAPHATQELLATSEPITDNVQNQEPAQPPQEVASSPVAETSPSEQHTVMETVNEKLQDAMEGVNEAVNDTVVVVKNMFGFGAKTAKEQTLEEVDVEEMPVDASAPASESLPEEVEVETKPLVEPEVSERDLQSPSSITHETKVTTEASSPTHKMLDRMNDSMHDAMDRVNESVHDTVEAVKNVFGWRGRLGKVVTSAGEEGEHTSNPEPDVVYQSEIWPPTMPQPKKERDMESFVTQPQASLPLEPVQAIEPLAEEHNQAIGSIAEFAPDIIEVRAETTHIEETIAEENVPSTVEQISAQATKPSPPVIFDTPAPVTVEEEEDEKDVLASASPNPVTLSRVAPPPSPETLVASHPGQPQAADASSEWTSEDMVTALEDIEVPLAATESIVKVEAFTVEPVVETAAIETVEEKVVEVTEPAPIEKIAQAEKPAEPKRSSWFSNPFSMKGFGFGKKDEAAKNKRESSQSVVMELKAEVAPNPIAPSPNPVSVEPAVTPSPPAGLVIESADAMETHPPPSSPATPILQAAPPSIESPPRDAIPPPPTPTSSFADVSVLEVSPPLPPSDEVTLPEGTSTDVATVVRGLGVVVEEEEEEVGESETANSMIVKEDVEIPTTAAEAEILNAPAQDDGDFLDGTRFAQNGFICSDCCVDALDHFAPPPSNQETASSKRVSLSNQEIAAKATSLARELRERRRETLEISDEDIAASTTSIHNVEVPETVQAVDEDIDDDVPLALAVKTEVEADDQRSIKTISRGVMSLWGRLFGKKSEDLHSTETKNVSAEPEKTVELMAAPATIEEPTPSTQTQAVRATSSLPRIASSTLPRISSAKSAQSTIEKPEPSSNGVLGWFKTLMSPSKTKDVDVASSTASIREDRSQRSRVDSPTPSASPIPSTLRSKSPRPSSPLPRTSSVKSGPRSLRFKRSYEEKPNSIRSQPFSTASSSTGWFSRLFGGAARPLGAVRDDTSERRGMFGKRRNKKRDDIAVGSGGGTLESRLVNMSVASSSNPGSPIVAPLQDTSSGGRLKVLTKRSSTPNFPTTIAAAPSSPSAMSLPDPATQVPAECSDCGGTQFRPDGTVCQVCVESPRALVFLEDERKPSVGAAPGLEKKNGVEVEETKPVKKFKFFFFKLQGGEPRQKNNGKGKGNDTIRSHATELEAGESKLTAEEMLKRSMSSESRRSVIILSSGSSPTQPDQPDLSASKPDAPEAPKDSISPHLLNALSRVLLRSPPSSSSLKEGEEDPNDDVLSPLSPISSFSKRNASREGRRKSRNGSSVSPSGTFLYHPDRSSPALSTVVPSTIGGEKVTPSSFQKGGAKVKSYDEAVAFVASSGENLESVQGKDLVAPVASSPTAAENADDVPLALVAETQKPIVYSTTPSPLIRFDDTKNRTGPQPITPVNSLQRSIASSGRPPSTTPARSPAPSGASSSRVSSFFSLFRLGRQKHDAGKRAFHDSASVASSVTVRATSNSMLRPGSPASTMLVSNRGLNGELSQAQLDARRTLDPGPQSQWIKEMRRSASLKRFDDSNQKRLSYMVLAASRGAENEALAGQPFDMQFPSVERGRSRMRRDRKRRADQENASADEHEIVVVVEEGRSDQLDDDAMSTDSSEVSAAVAELVREATKRLDLHFGPSDADFSPSPRGTLKGPRISFTGSRTVTSLPSGNIRVTSSRPTRVWSEQVDDWEAALWPSNSASDEVTAESKVTSPLEITRAEKTLSVGRTRSPPVSPKSFESGEVEGRLSYETVDDGQKPQRRRRFVSSGLRKLYRDVVVLDGGSGDLDDMVDRLWKDGAMEQNYVQAAFESAGSPPPPAKRGKRLDDDEESEMVEQWIVDAAANQEIILPTTLDEIKLWGWGDEGANKA